MNYQEQHQKQKNNESVEPTPLVSVVIATYNGATTLVRTIEHVLQQTYTNYEIIVVDDGSTDDTRSVLDPFILRGDIAYYYQANAGCGAARNYGVTQSRGELIAFLDADDYWHQEKLMQQIAVFREFPDTVVCYTESYSVDPFSAVVWQTKRDVRYAQRSGNMIPYLAIANPLTLSSTLVTRDAFTAVGGFTERYDRMMLADYDLWLKLAPRGPFRAITNPLTFYQVRHPDSDRAIARRAVMKNYVLTLKIFVSNWKYAPGWYTLGFIWALILIVVNYIRSLRIQLCA
jgi:glycosyltransferase involved in cell wall biosynthesis